MDWTVDYGVLAQDKELINRYENLNGLLIELQQVLLKLLPMSANYYKMPVPDRIELDLFVAYTMNSLQWVHMRIRGEDPTTQPIKDELIRVKKVMMKWNEIKDKSKRPTVNIQATKRFIKSGLYDRYAGSSQFMNKKMKFTDDDDK